MKSLGNDVHNLSDIMCMRIKIYQKFIMALFIIVNEGRHIRIGFKYSDCGSTTDILMGKNLEFKSQLFH